MLKIDGLDELERTLAQITEKAGEFETAQEIPLSDLLSDSLVQRHTRFGSLQEMVDAGGGEDSAKIGSAEWEAFIAQNTDFGTWDAMLEAGAADFLRGKLGF